MVFVVASHTMVVNANTNPDGTMKRGKTPNLPKSDLRGTWRKEDPRLAVVVDTGKEQGGYTYVTKATSVRTHEDHTGSGRSVRHDQLFGRNDPPEELEFGRRGRSVGGLTQVRGRQLGLTGGGGRTDALLASRLGSSSSDYYEPLSTVTEKFKSVTTRQPTVTQRPAAQRTFEYEYHAPVFASLQHKPPVSGVSASRLRVSGVTPTSRSSAPSSALVPYQKSSALSRAMSYDSLEDEYEEAKRRALRSRSEQISRRENQDRLYAPSRPPHSPVIPASYRGLSLVAHAHERDSRDYTIPARHSIHHPVLPTFVTARGSTGAYLTGRTYPYTSASATMTSTPSGFFRGRRHSLPSRPSEVLVDTYSDDLYDPYSAARRHDSYLSVPRRTHTPVSQVHTIPAPRSYSPIRTHYSPLPTRRSRYADIESSLEATYMPETSSLYAGLRSRAAEARSKIDVHKTMMDRYLPVHLGPEKDVGMPQLERYRPSTVPSKVTPYRPVSRPERRMSLPSTPTRVVAPSPPRRAPMSDARKRAREVLCKTKHDPEYYSY